MVLFIFLFSNISNSNDENPQVNIVINTPNNPQANNILKANNIFILYNL